MWEKFIANFQRRLNPDISFCVHSLCKTIIINCNAEIYGGRPESLESAFPEGSLEMGIKFEHAPSPNIEPFFH